MPHSRDYLHDGADGARGEPTGQRPYVAPEMEDFRGNQNEYGGVIHRGTFLGADETHMYLSPLSGSGADSTDARRIDKGYALSGDWHGDVKDLIGKRVAVNVHSQVQRNGGWASNVAGRFNVIKEDGKPDMDFYNSTKNRRIDKRTPGQPLMSDPSTPASRKAFEEHMERMTPKEDL